MGNVEEESRLPEAYTRYFDMRRQGKGLSEIADELGIPEEAMDAFIVLAHAKLASRASEAGDGPDRPS